MPGRKDLFFLILFLSFSIIISCRVKEIVIKNDNCIKAKGISEKEILLASSSCNLQYDLNGDSINDGIKANNLNLSKIKTFLLNMYVCCFNC
ncbi:SIMPL domain-containing protein [Borreliella finlandensis]|uniref:SIMPL domain-containing protein n=1 Tax=Borreliella finlandensis TaxID=498741 RepID=UPI0026495CAA|nr:SIMPL domain-containing protein [Borreliella finlandensis]WKC89753.1 SIMPL domain-containing protein [Borreliella finlandensis]